MHRFTKFLHNEATAILLKNLWHLQVTSLSAWSGNRTFMTHIKSSHWQPGLKVVSERSRVSPLSSFLPSLSFPCPLEAGPLKSSWGGPGERCKLLQRAQPPNAFWCIFSLSGRILANIFKQLVLSKLTSPPQFFFQTNPVETRQIKVCRVCEPVQPGPL